MTDTTTDAASAHVGDDAQTATQAVTTAAATTAVVTTQAVTTQAATTQAATTQAVTTQAATTQAATTQAVTTAAASAQLPGYHDTKAAHLARLRRIEGQVRGLQRMVDGDTYCIDVLTQVSAATRALESFALGLLNEHLSHCVSHAIEAGSDSPEARAEAEAKIREASDAIARLVRS